MVFAKLGRKSMRGIVMGFSNASLDRNWWFFGICMENSLAITITEADKGLGLTPQRQLHSKLIRNGFIIFNFEINT